MKGVSPLIATVLLILIVITIAALITSYTSTFVRSSQQTIENRTSTSVECAGASIIIDEVFLTLNSSSVPSSARARVINNGIKDDLILTSGELFNRTGANFLASGLPVADFDVGEIEIVRFNNINVTKCGDFSEIIIATNCGVGADTFTKTPRCS